MNLLAAVNIGDSVQQELDIRPGKDRAERDAQQARGNAQEKTGAGNGEIQPATTTGAPGVRPIR
jgi:hypothetical protein